MVPSSAATRLAVLALALSAGLAAAGFAWEFARFGRGPEATAQRLQSDVRQRIAVRTRQVEWLARRVASQADLVAAAAAGADPSPELFDQLIAFAGQAQPAYAGSISATVYVPSGPAGEYRVLAWSDGPAEVVPNDRLAEPPRLFVALGTLGPRLVYLEPVDANGHRVAVAAAEIVLSPPTRVGDASGAYPFQTAYGPVTISQVYPGTTDVAPARPRAFTVTDESGAPLLDVQFDPERLAASRRQFRRRVLGLAAAPLVLLLFLAAVPALDRRIAAHDLRRFDAWSVVAGVLIVAGALSLTAVMRYAGAPIGVIPITTGLAALALAFLFPVSWWWRGDVRHQSQARPARFVLEQLLGGLATLVALVAATRLVEAGLPPTALDRWPPPVIPTDAGGLLTASGLLVAELAIGWTVAGLLGWLAGRWRVTWRHPATGAAAAGLWVLPTAVALAVPAVWTPPPVTAVVAPLVAAALFAIFAVAFRRYYRRTTPAMRLLLLFLAMVLPPATLFPMTALTAERQARTLIERVYAPATVNHPERLQEQLAEANREIDALTSLPDLVAASRPAGQVVQSSLANYVWNQTILSRARVTSEVELFGPGPDRALVSRFGLNVPEYQSPVGEGSWTGTSCGWEVYSEVKRFGADDRLMWHAQRGLCRDGRVLGAIVVHVVPDYQSLPFITSANPYREVLASSDETANVPRFEDLEVVIYGWGRTPVFTSGTAAWSVSDALFSRLRKSRQPFWTELNSDDTQYEVYVVNDRSFVYAFGYPHPTPFEYATRLAELATMMAALFVLLLVSATLVSPLRARRTAPLRVLYHEVRTSFYRKLYLFFVLAAIGPVVLLALTFGAYMSARLQADVVSEAESIVTVARRVYEELAAAQQHPDPMQAPPTDDVMVWIRQVIDQDVNIYRGAGLLSTSQRDLFDSGLLPTRTPATVYRAIAIQRLPTYVGRDRIGAFQYLVAAAPVPAGGPDTVLSVPLALRQREIERELDELNRGVLVAAVVVVLFAAGLGASVAGRVSDPVARLTRATRQIAAGRFDVRIEADTADELRRLVDDFNSMTRTLEAQRAELARTNQLKAWAEMARQVAHEIKNPLTPIQLAAEHLDRVHEDQRRPLGAVADQCLQTIYRQVRLLRQIASEFSNFAGTPTVRLEAVALADLVREVVDPYRNSPRVSVHVHVSADLPPVLADRTLLARAVTNLVENAVQAMPDGGRLQVRAAAEGARVVLTVADTGVGMAPEAVERAFEPYFSTKTGGSGLGLPNARRNIELQGGEVELASTPGRGTTVTVRLAVASPPASAAG
ncbi:MAG: ATP-binding protein [Vicinamibacterales bacterium]